ncbi:MAG: hypothetical protein NVS1B14_01070 [Vulcanimicrobiaceae bacterium]
MLPLTYILPLRATSLDGLAELTQYLHARHADVELIVVDGSAPDVFAAHARAWANLNAVHIAPDACFAGGNGKVRGVLTGLQRASFEKVVIADDDVRYDAVALHEISGALDGADVVRPQNYFRPQVWHAVFDTARTLLNRVTGGDWPGTLGLRRSALPNGYSAHVLFENLELVRTVLAAGGRETVRYDLYVARRPPSVAHFLRQRVRQAYDEFARPLRLAAWLAVIPALALGVYRRRLDAIAIGAATIMLAAETGRRRAGGQRYFPMASTLVAPGWVLERGICAWLAVAHRVFRGGIRYSDGLLRDAATPLAQLKRDAA